MLFFWGGGVHAEYEGGDIAEKKYINSVSGLCKKKCKDRYLHNPRGSLKTAFCCFTFTSFF